MFSCCFFFVVGVVVMMCGERGWGGGGERGRALESKSILERGFLAYLAKCDSVE